jgi:hypothetical protein
LVVRPEFDDPIGPFRKPMKLKAVRCPWILAPLLWATFAGQSHADVLPPPSPLQCDLGQDVTTDHSGTHCKYRICHTEAVCPPGMACLAHAEADCDPRGRPCLTRLVSRCSKTDVVSPVPRCPRGATPDPRRSEATLALLRTREDGKSVLGQLACGLTICYGEVPEGIVQSDGVLVLQNSSSKPANAARVGHLLLHLLRGAPLDEVAVRAGTLPCNQLAGKAREAEQQAHRFETLLRKAFGLEPLAFEDLFDSFTKRCQTLRRK